jgi:hypothetical protein
MKNLFQKNKHILFMKLCGLIFGLHLVFVFIITLFEYTNPFSFFANENIKISTRGSLLLRHDVSDSVQSIEFNNRIEGNQVTATFSKNEIVNVKLDFDNFVNSLDINLALVIILDLLYVWIWLFVSYSFWRLSKSLNTTDAFNNRNLFLIKRLSFVFPIAAIIHGIWAELFSLLVNENIKIEGFYFYSPNQIWGLKALYNEELVGSFLIMIILLMITRFFILGSDFKKEVDLTI